MKNTYKLLFFDHGDWRIYDYFPTFREAKIVMDGLEECYDCKIVEI